MVTRRVGLLRWTVLLAGACGRSEPVAELAPLPEIPVARTFGGTGNGQVRDVAGDLEGNVVVVGGTDAADFACTTGPAPQGSHDVFVRKYDGDGTLLWSRLIGGPAYDRAYAVELDGAGFVYVAGRAGAGYPTTPGALQAEFGGDDQPNRLYGPQDAFVTKLTPDGAQIVWSTYFGAEDGAIFRDLDVDDEGRVYAVLCGASAVQPHVTPGAFATERPVAPFGVVTRLSADGQTVEWATYLGGHDGGYALGTPTIRVAANGDAVVVGHAASTSLPTTAGAHARQAAGRSDLYVARLSADGARLVFATYLGGSEIEFGDTHNAVLDRDGNVVVAATTRSADFPVTEGAFQTRFGGAGGQYNQTGDGFVAVLSGDRGALLRATYLGGSSGEGLEGVTVLTDGTIVVSGGTYSADFPARTAPAGLSPPGKDRPHAFAVGFDPTLRSLRGAVVLGGDDWDLGLAVTAAPANACWVGGETRSRQFLDAAPVNPDSKTGFAVRLVWP